MSGIGWLILVGIVLVAGYLGWSNWRERGHRRQVERMFHRDREMDRRDPEGRFETNPDAQPYDPVVGHLDDDVEAGLTPAAGVFAVEDTAADGPLMRSFHETSPVAKMPEVSEKTEAFQPALPLYDTPPAPSQIEAVASLVFGKPGRLSLTHLIERLQSAACNLRIVGLNEAGELEKPVANHAYQRIDVYLLLASRCGPVAEACVGRFCDELDVFAIGHALTLICPDRDEILAQARDLDAFCEKVDVVTSLSVVAPEGYPFRGSAIHRLVSDVGLKWNATGVYVMQDDAGTTLFSLFNREVQPFLPAGAELTTHGFTLNLEVPRVIDGLSVFAHMTGIARMLADRLSGQVVDADDRPLTPSRLQDDHDRLQDVYERMAARGIPAGSEAALRVFS